MPDPFIIIGENIHTTRALRRSGQRITTDPDGAEAVSFRAAQGERRYLLIPGRVKHVQIALRAAMAEPTTTQAEPTTTQAEPTTAQAETTTAQGGGGAPSPAPAGRAPARGRRPLPRPQRRRDIVAP